jgi:hypothetical protein
MTIHFCSNLYGSQKLLMWIVGTAKKPLLFRLQEFILRILGLNGELIRRHGWLLSSWWNGVDGLMQKWKVEK